MYVPHRTHHKYPALGAVAASPSRRNVSFHSIPFHPPMTQPVYKSRTTTHPVINPTRSSPSGEFHSRSHPPFVPIDPSRLSRWLPHESESSCPVPMLPSTHELDANTHSQCSAALLIPPHRPNQSRDRDIGPVNEVDLPYPTILLARYSFLGWALVLRI